MLVNIPHVLTPDELKTVRAAIEAAPFADGKETAGFRNQRIKRNEQVPKAWEGRNVIQKTVIDALMRSVHFRHAALPHHVFLPTISRYRPGMAYGQHVDDALMGPNDDLRRADVSLTVFINEPTEYDGGELLINSPFGPQMIKLPAGSAIVYPSSTLHEVRPVTRGERLVVISWVQSHVRDERQRMLLADLAMIGEKLNKVAPNDQITDLAFKCHVNLLRMWSEN
ncbi:Fe2+-dependent dioxygenase [Dongia soli]|uniref:Fe2+-dependent dioxygenase n=1 Tax=Dongia soli TaxID=600628 RepID=A0ABU5EFR3_9PROT|nr:Fe2+-dependent dioxygenase [Dongia soli]MDY0885056.1 Fe2+-dependent dioxygenase [Dongia soli]